MDQLEELIADRPDFFAHVGGWEAWEALLDEMPPFPAIPEMGSLRR